MSTEGDAVEDELVTRAGTIGAPELGGEVEWSWDMMRDAVRDCEV